MSIFQFPSDFRWGAATAAYQIEGAYAEDGRGLSIWDTFSHTPGKVKNGDNGDVACDSYHRYKEDIAYMKELGITTYRFSVSWPRIYPQGRGEVNLAGLDFYHRFVDELLKNGIEPFCTLYHWDLPQALQDEGGWNNRDTAIAFKQYAETMFKEFSGKIKKWITLNEPWCSSFLSNYLGVHAPGYRDLQLAVNVAHNLLRAHGEAVRSYREHGYDGEIGIAPNITWAYPYTSSEQDKEVCQRAIEWTWDWFLDPIYFGRYPERLLKVFEKGGAKPDVQPGDMETIRQPVDFIGGNYYTASVRRYAPGNNLFDDEELNMGYDRTDIGWPLDSVGLYDSLRYTHQKYGNVPIYITENGACINDEPVDGKVNDIRRIQYLRQHIISMHRAISDGVPVKGYMEWSLLDNFEWAEGYGMRFGLIHVDYRTLKRTPKESFYWYQKLAKNNFLVTE
ncbi:MAG TPA: GH1 family beta-glucosidase [Paenibacillus cookii]|nr:GH1 family beta-glucosidase [Paenibacillus cookii]